MESFKNGTATGFTIGGSAVLTGTGGTGNDAVGAGYLRLTSNANDQAGYAIDNNTFPAPQGFRISFEFFSYGGNGADGFSVFLIDGATSTFNIGAPGGSLGYAQKTGISGVSNGYVGIGIDEFGNFSNPSEGRVGGPGATSDAVAIRGAGNGSGASDYPYLTGSATLPFSVDVTTARAQSGNADYRRAFIDVTPVTTNGTVTYRITARIQHGNTVTTAVNSFQIPVPPATLRIGFAGSTGGNTNFHEIRNLSIVQVPVANDDNLGTTYNQATTANLLANDQAPGSSLDAASVDLDPTTAGQQTTYTVTGKGTFTVNNQGVVTFTPSGSFSGVVSTPYTVKNIIGDESLPATITVVVTGADVATSVSGPSNVNPGSSTSYQVTATNVGQETALNVIPTLTLPAGVTYVSGGSFNTTTRVVSFPQTTLTDGQSVSNNVVLGFPTAASYSLTSGYTYPTGAAIPDADATNNNSTLSVTVTGTGNVTGVCSLPGKDGVASLSAGNTYNTYYPGTANAAAGATSISVGTPTGSTTAIAAGDLLLVMQMQSAATINTNNNSNYGTLGTGNTAGRYEYVVASGPVSGGSVPLRSGLANAYTATNATFQVIRVPQYSSVSLSGTVTAPAWNGSTGGVLALEVGGNVNFTNGTLSMNGKGFRGGAGRVSLTGTRTDYVVASTSNRHGSKGEGVAGMPEQVYVGGAAVTTTTNYEDYAVGSYARGNAGTGGGGGTIGGSLTNQAGGGGGGNYGSGGNGQFINTGTTANRTTGGIGGGPDNLPSAARLYLGGGGGAGSTADALAALGASGGTGGGLILVRASSFSGTNTITANGDAGRSPGNTSNNGSGGGGAGGTVVLTAGSGLNNLTVNATGGAGGTSTYDGGGGGGGAIFTNGALAASNTTAGANGSAAASDGTTTTNATVGADCTPTLTTSLRTTTPQVNKSTSMTADYVLTISNTGGGYQGLSITPALVTTSNGLFTYASTSQVALRLPNGTTQTLSGTQYSVTGTGTSTPTITVAANVEIPAGASIEVSFRANIGSTAEVGGPYNSNASANYLDHARTSAAATRAANGYTSAGTATAPDAVTITRPLPVELVRFVAVGRTPAAVLTWATAQELRNDRFEVERSTDGSNFEKIGTVRGHGTTTSASEYSFVDARAAQVANVLYYRLRQVDTDGQFAYSPVQAVRFNGAQPGKGDLRLFPNPTDGDLTLDMTLLPADAYQVTLTDLTGRHLRTVKLRGGALHTLPMQTLATGSYLVSVRGTSLNLVQKVVKQ